MLVGVLAPPSLESLAHQLGRDLPLGEGVKGPAVIGLLDQAHHPPGAQRMLARNVRDRLSALLEATDSPHAGARRSSCTAGWGSPGSSCTERSRSALRDETLARSLKELFLSPLANQRDGGAASLQTLREYLASVCNASKAATRLGVTRHTVENRLNTVQQHLGRELDSCLVELEVALRLAELDPSGRRDD